MSRVEAFMLARKVSARKKATRYVVYDGPDFGADSCGQGGFQVSNDEDLEGFYNGCEIVAAFTDGQIEE